MTDDFDPDLGDVAIAPPKAEPKPAAPVAPAKPQHNARTLMLAAELGIPQSQIDAATPERLDYAVDLMAQQALARAKQQNYRQPEPAARQAEPPPPPEPEVDLGLADEELDPRFSGALKNLFKQQQKEIQELKAKLGAVEQHYQTQARETVFATADRFFGNQPTVFGQGTVRQIVKGSPEAVRRSAVFNAATQIQGDIPFEQKLEQASTALFGTTAPAAPVQPAPTPDRPRDSNGRYLSAEERRWMESGLATPTHRSGGGEVKGERLAVANLAKRLTSLGVNPNGVVQEEVDLPE